LSGRWSFDPRTAELNQLHDHSAYLLIQWPISRIGHATLVNCQTTLRVPDSELRAKFSNIFTGRHLKYKKTTRRVGDDLSFLALVLNEAKSLNYLSYVQILVRVIVVNIIRRIWVIENSAK
jgi:hypothetical protein